MINPLIFLPCHNSIRAPGVFLLEMTARGKMLLVGIPTTGLGSTRDKKSRIVSNDTASLKNLFL